MLKAIVMTSLISVGLQAQTEGPWQPVANLQSGQAVLFVRTVELPEGLHIQFKNEGRQRVHFSFHLKEYQKVAQRFRNGRVHLSPGRQTSSIPLQSLVPLRGPELTPSAFQLHSIRLGDNDLGPSVNP